MAVHTTNYFDTFIHVAEDCPVESAEVPPGEGTVARFQYDLLMSDPYRRTSDDLLFDVHAIRKEIPANRQEVARQTFFSKGQPCMRASPLAKRYGWGVRSDVDGRIGLVAMESAEYRSLSEDETVTHLKAMRSKRA